ncbi:hypothetical protein BDV23DRAFT_166609 [Aspergillus alliaceus]|uniref:Uncharacterized protein n=1 Tax=Petromyces alliaceus TaxID=209559 RepID=A0A5N7BRT0_PETAA|nr:hypothetical protein BDV23DRAFT_166609 [Aspergillus alliaceus]
MLLLLITAASDSYNPEPIQTRSNAVGNISARNKTSSVVQRAITSSPGRKRYPTTGRLHQAERTTKY